MCVLKSGFQAGYQPLWGSTPCLAGNSRFKFRLPVRLQFAKLCCRIRHILFAAPAMSLRPFHFTHRLGLLAAVLLPIIATSGCSRWSKEFFNPQNFNPDHYRDERAVEI